MRPRAGFERMLTPEDLADMLQLSRRTVLKLTRRGEIRGVRVGNRIRYTHDEVAAWLKARGGGR